MKPLYRLLRNNFESGPFTLEKLKKQHLQPTDLIWVEGSTAWAYPAEIKELQLSGNSHPTNKTKQPKESLSLNRQRNLSNRINKITRPAAHQVHLPQESEFDQRVEALRKNILSYKPFYRSRFINASTESKKPLPSSAAGQDSIEIVWHGKEKAYLPHFLVAGLIFLLFIAAWYKIKFPSKNNVTTEEAVAQPYKPSPYSTTTPFSQPNLQAPKISEITQIQEARPSISALPIKILKKKPSIQQANLVIEDTQNLSKQIAEQPIQTEVQPKAIEVQPEKPEQPLIENSISQVEKKKTIGQALKGIFKKKNKNETSEKTD